jgi:hypothetical protein
VKACSGPSFLEQILLPSRSASGTYQKLLKFNESAAGAIFIASRAELLAHYGRFDANSPKFRLITPKLPALLGINIL